MKQVFIVLLIYISCRVLFYLFNSNYFIINSFTEFFKVFFYGLRFDISAICFTNAPYFLLALIPIKNKLYQKTINIYFILSNTIFITLNITDIEYFKFTLKRSTYDLFSLLKLGSDTQNLLLPFALDYWYIFIIAALWFYVFWKSNEKLSKLPNNVSFKLKNYLIHTAVSLFILGFAIIGARGGLQLKPINMVNASKYVKSENTPLVLNTTFTILKTSDLQKLTEPNYFPKAYLKEHINELIKYPSHNNDSTKSKNVVLIILESFSNKYVTKNTTPFLDSLIKKGTYYPNSYANAKKSIEGIPAIISGIPALSSTPFIQSVYVTNPTNSLAMLLKKIGYSTNFYHGGNNGTMGFDSYTAAAGYNKYFGLNEYPNTKDYDGTWGIFDEPYLQYFSGECSRQQQPFFNTIFTLSSHHPYTIPKKHTQKFTNPNKIENTISYTDYALSEFFKTAKQQPWYNNTVFVITADHTSSGISNRKEIYKIPILFYEPNQVAETNNNIISQVDILPTLLTKLNYPEPYFAFGKLNNNYSVSFLTNHYQIIGDTYLLQFDGKKSTALYNHINDGLLQNNLIGKLPKIQHKLESELKLRIQAYSYCLINNKMTLQNFNKQ